MMLLVLKKVITQRWQSLYKVRVFCEAKGGAADDEFGKTTFDKLWTLDCTLLSFNLSFLL